MAGNLQRFPGESEPMERIPTSSWCSYTGILSPAMLLLVWRQAPPCALIGFRRRRAASPRRPRRAFGGARHDALVLPRLEPMLLRPASCLAVAEVHDGARGPALAAPSTEHGHGEEQATQLSKSQICRRAPLVIPFE